MAKPAEKISPPGVGYDESRRLPPGQVLTRKWPVLTYGETPTFDPERWDFRTFGEVENELRLGWEEFLKLPRVEVLADFHCVTRWSRLNNRWEGVSSAEILKRAKPTPSARFVMLHCDGGYTTNLSMADFSREGVLFALRHDGADLSAEHGGPLRLVVPHLYAWKSAKWVRAVEFMPKDRRGFWEVNGYHNHADPWREERYAWQEEGEEE